MPRCRPLFIVVLAGIVPVLPASLIAEENASPWLVHDRQRPQSPVVTPAETIGQPPEDATVLFDGSSLDNWETIDGAPTRWQLSDGCMIPTPDSGPHRTKAAFGDVQLHVEWSSPSPPQGSGQGRGNSGVYLMSKYEVQVLDSFENETYADGRAAAIYGQNPPMVNASRSPGEWQTYDIIFRRPRFREDGQIESPAIMTVIHNGIVVQDHFPLWGPTNWLKANAYTQHPDKLPLMLQDHGNPVRFRNIWVRELNDSPTFTSMRLAEPTTSLTKQQLQELVGTYNDAKVRLQDSSLQLRFTDRWFDLVPISLDTFQLKRTDATATFLRQNDNTIQMELTLMGSKSKKTKQAERPEENTNSKQGTDMSDYVGLTEEAAIAKAEKEGRRCRTIKRDGQSFPMTRDYRPDRVNLTVESGKVVKAPWRIDTVLLATVNE